MTTVTNPTTDVTKRQGFVLLFDVSDGNPNGDPDAGNLPRTDPETMQGLVTDVALKRKVRDYVDIAHGTEQRFKIYVQHGEYLTDQRARVFAERASGRKDADVKAMDARAWMCDEFYDVRMFGAVMSMKEKNAGQVRGPVQLKFARSIDPIVYQDVTIVGPAQRQGETAQRGDNEDQVEAPGTMGRKATVPYGLYRTHGFFNPHFAKDTGVTAADLELLWQALQLMWDQDHSAARGEMTCRGLYVFSHDSSLGNAPSHVLFDRITVARNVGVEATRKFSHYTVTVDGVNLPNGVTLTRLVG